MGRSPMPGTESSPVAAPSNTGVDPVSVTVHDAQGQDRDISLKPLQQISRRDLISLPVNIKIWPLGLQTRKASYWFELVPDRKALYCRYDRCADIFLAAITIAATVIFWL